MRQSGMTGLIEKRIHDARKAGKIRYRLSDLIVRIILHILDGDLRLSCYARNPNLVLFREIFCGNEPHPTAILNALKANKLLTNMLGKILLRSALKTLTEYCRKNKIRKVYIDMDQSAREIHGHQENVAGGYFANKPKNTKGFQFRIWSVRDLKIILKADLYPGSAHSQTNVKRDFRLILKALKKAGIIGVFVGDSGFLCGEICNLIEESGHQFIFAQAQHKQVKQRGKNAKNKRTAAGGTVVIKERMRPITGKFKHQFREIYIQVLSPDGQLWFDFAADQFTNVLVTNMDLTAEDIYTLYRGHAVIETIIEELKNDFGTGIAHAAEFHVNATMTVCTALAYNIKNSFLDFHKIQLRQGERMKLSTFQSRWLHIPGLFSRSGNRRILRIQQAAYDQFARLQIAA
jgi:hypothetical protein